MKILFGVILVILGAVLIFLVPTTGNISLMVVGVVGLIAGGILLTWGLYEWQKKQIAEADVLVVTTETVSGKKIVKTLGAIQARNNPLFGAALAEINARKNLVREARKLGANAVVGVRTERQQHRKQITYYLYGTAVVLEDSE